MVASPPAPSEPAALVGAPTSTEVPSFMQAASRSSEVEPAHALGPGAKQSHATPSWTTETAAVDVRAILKAAVPFSRGASSSAVATPAPQKRPARPGGGVSTETTAVDVAKILGKAVPFGVARPTAPESPATPAGRWVRFDPQTGKALAEPYWEGLPPVEKKK